MAGYTILDQIDITRLLKLFGVESWHDYSPMPGGQANTSYRINAGEISFVLTICDERGFGSVRKLAALLEYLKESGYRTTTLIEAKKGGFVGAYQGKPVILKRFEDGIIKRDLDNKALWSLGEKLGELHHIPAPEFLPHTHEYGISAFSKIYQCCPGHEFSAWLADKALFIEQSLDKRSLPTGLVHGDLFWDNALLKKDREVMVIDFEQASKTHLVFDVGMSLAGLCSPEGVFSLDKARYFIQGYSQVRPLSRLERNLLQRFAVYGAASTAFWRFQQYNIKHPGHDKHESYKVMRYLADMIQVMPKEEFQRCLS